VLKYLLCFFFALSFGAIYSQDIESVVKAKPLKVSGGVGTDHVFYHANGIDARRNSPYQYYFNGNLNFVLFGELNIPLTFSYSNQRFNYSQPLNQQRFNQFGISPKYRWITAHIGWRNMTFSPYSLNGHTFAGGGIELSPGKYHISAMYGRLLKAVEYDTTETGATNKPAYLRIGAGINVTYEDMGNQYGFSVFRSYDDPSSLKIPLDSIGITPEQNLVASLKVRQKIGSKIQAEGEFGNSSITKDSRFKDETKQKTAGLIEENTTTVNYSAYKVKIGYKLKKANIGAGYERIAPGYRTHGAYYFNNDLENITLNYARPFFKNKVNLSFNIGTQRNNLDKSKISTMRRRIGSFNLSWTPVQKLNFSANYSNFQTYTNMRSQFTTINNTNPYQNIDTLNYIQITQSLSFNTNYAIASNEKRQQNLSLNLSAQKASEEQGGTKLPSGTTFYNMNLAYMYAIVPANLAFNLALNGNWNQSSLSDSKILGPTAGISKGMFKKQLLTNISYSWNTTLNNNTSTGYVGSLRFTNTLSVKKKHSFTMSVVWLNRVSKVVSTLPSSFNEWTGRVGYAYRF
jgi:hypothetical protein